MASKAAEKKVATRAEIVAQMKADAARRQEITLVHFSAQPEPFLTLNKS